MLLHIGNLFRVTASPVRNYCVELGDLDLLTPERAAKILQFLTLAKTFTDDPSQIQAIQEVIDATIPGASESRILIACRYLRAETQKLVFNALEELNASKTETANNHGAPN